MQSVEALQSLTEISSAQWGLLTTAQAAMLGVSRVQLGRLAASGNLERLAHGIYKDAGSPPDEYDKIRAVWLSTDPIRTAGERIADGAEGVIIDGSSAAYLHNIGDLQPEPYVFASKSRRQSQRPDVRYRHRSLSTDDITIAHGLPTTSIERTIADLVLDREDTSLVADVLADAVRNTPVRLDLLAEHLDPLAARNRHAKNDGRGFLEDLLEQGGVDIATQSARIIRNPAWQTFALPELNKIVEQAIKNVVDSTDFSKFAALKFQVPDYSKLVNLKIQPPDNAELLRSIAAAVDQTKFLSPALSDTVKSVNSRSLENMRELAKQAAALDVLSSLSQEEPDDDAVDAR